MDNPFRPMVKLSDESISGIANAVGLSRTTIAKLIAKEISRKTKLETLDKLASHFGYRVKVELEKVNGE